MRKYSVSIKSLNSKPSKKEWEELSNGLPIELIEKANRFKSWHQKALRLIGWQLLLSKLNELNCSELINYVCFTEKGKPFFEEGNVFFNFSNTKDTIILVVSDFKIGVDLEFNRSCKKSIYTRVFCKEEIEFLENSMDESTDFITLWTKKEAVVKLFGGGISMGLNNFSVLKNKINVFDKTVIIDKYKVKEGIAHIAFFKP